ncbi:MAG: site-2 protease family protein [Clostridia bacterium]|nr:site-2 protease family protein [Clostridia bacterium]
MIFLYVILAILILLIMITIHEFGHYLSAKLLRFDISEFSIGFGPKIFKRKSKKTDEVFSIGVLPLGGYCAFYDEKGDASDENTIPANKKPFNSEKPWKRLIVLLSGPLLNLFSAFFFSFIYILAVGYAVPTVVEIYDNPFTGESYVSALETGDEIIAINDVDINVMNSFSELTANNKLGESLKFTILRDGEEQDVYIAKQNVSIKTESGEYVSKELFGFTSSNTVKSVSFEYAFGMSFPYTFKLSGMIIGSFGQLITGQIPLTELSGPIGTVTTMATYAELDWRYILLFLPLIASNLAIFNLFPIPSLDGARAIFTIIEWLRGKPINRKIEGYIHTVGLLMLLAFVLIIDVVGIFMRYLQ